MISLVIGDKQSESERAEMPKVYGQNIKGHHNIKWSDTYLIIEFQKGGEGLEKNT